MKYILIIIVLVLSCNMAHAFNTGDKVYHDNPRFKGDIFTIAGINKDNGFVYIVFRGTRERGEKHLSEGLLMGDYDGRYKEVFTYDSLCNLTPVGNFAIEKLQGEIETLRVKISQLEIVVYEESHHGHELCDKQAKAAQCRIDQLKTKIAKLQDLKTTTPKPNIK